MKETYRSIWIILLILSGSLSLTRGQSSVSEIKREAYLKQILKWLPGDRPGFGRISYLDSTFTDWLERTGELPPDFALMPSIPDLPDPLIMDEGISNKPVEDRADWIFNRKKILKEVQYYLTGNFPPPPEHIQAEVLYPDRMNGPVRIRNVELSFGPDREAKLHLELMIPPGEGPFPVFLTQWNHREWAQIAVRRGYLACIYAGSDGNDDTEEYSRIWAEEYDFTRLMRRAWGSFRAIDYLYSLKEVDQDKIAMTGHSRNGKQSLIAAAFDSRIKAVIPSSGGTGAEVPWRYCAYPYDVEDIALLGPAQPSWLHPRLRFFVGREDKLPFDQNSLMALIAPRGLMLSTAREEGASNPWGIEQAYRSAKTVYDFLDSENQIALRYRRGRHGTTAEDIEAYIDFFDFIFGRSAKKIKSQPSFHFSFEEWKEKSGEAIDLKNLPEFRDSATITQSYQPGITGWKIKSNELHRRATWLLGEKPVGVVHTSGPEILKAGGQTEEYFGNVIPRPKATSTMERMAISPYHGFGDYLYGYLYYAKDTAFRKEDMPVVIYLHEYDYSKGFSSMGFEHNIPAYFEELVKRGFAVFAYDMIGFGSRQEEGLNFYDRYPHWSKMGKMVEDVKGAVDALSDIEGIDRNRIFVSGYALGGTVGLYATALDSRIAGLITIGGFTPMWFGRNGKRHLQKISDQHLLIPRLGFFADHRESLPVDYKDLLSMIAPRPVLVIAPKYDQEADQDAILYDFGKALKTYQLYSAEHKLEIFTPDDYNRFSEEMRWRTYDWLEKFKQ